MAENGVTGVYNFTNPGAISHNEVLDLYKKYIDPSFTYKNFTLEQQVKVIKAGRSNCELDSTKLYELGVAIPVIHDSYEKNGCQHEFLFTFVKADYLLFLLVYSIHNLRV